VIAQVPNVYLSVGQKLPLQCQGVVTNVEFGAEAYGFVVQSDPPFSQTDVPFGFCACTLLGCT
jgi:hypothetical protein